MKYLDVPSSGSIADRTHSHNRAGQYTRNRRSPVQPIGTGRRAFIRGAFGSASGSWSGLTGPQQEAWISFAADHPITDALGQSVVLTGHQMYVALGVNLLNVGQPLPTVPPASLDLPDISAIIATVSVATGVDVSGFTGLSTDFITFAVSKPQGAGRRFNKTFWQPPGTFGYFPADSSPWDLAAADYNAEFGAPSVGQVVFVKVTAINAGGWAGVPVIVRCIAGA